MKTLLGPDEIEGLTVTGIGEYDGYLAVHFSKNRSMLLTSENQSRCDYDPAVVSMIDITVTDAVFVSLGITTHEEMQAARSERDLTRATVSVERDRKEYERLKKIFD